MELAGLTVPEGFLRSAQNGLFPGGAARQPRDGIDAYGHPLSLALAEIYDEPSTLLRATIRVAIGFEADAWYGARTPDVAGAITDVVDFSRVLCFGSSSEGEPFCFDFRDEPERPSVICWDGDVLSWRRIAPNIEAFLDIFQ